MNIIYLHSAKQYSPVDATGMQTMEWGRATDSEPLPLCPIPMVGCMATGTAGEKARCFNKDKCKGLGLGRSKRCTALVRNP